MALEPIIRRAQQGDREAIAQLYELHVERIFRYITYRVTEDADAEDLTTEVFIKMVEGLPGFRVTSVPFEAWLYRIASARVIDYHRRNRRRPQTELPETLSSDDLSPEASLEQKQELDAMRQALSILNGEQQTILILRFVERKSHQEVAEIINKSATAVRSIQHRALSQLAAHLGETKARHYLRGLSADE